MIKIKTERDNSPSEYAADNVSHAADRAVDKGQKVIAKTFRSIVRLKQTRSAHTAAKATVSTVKAIIAATKALISAVMACAFVAVFIIIVICLVGLILGSGFGVFFANDVPDSTKLSSVVQELSNEYYKQIEEIEQSVPHDYVEYEAADGVTAIVWQDVLAVYAAQGDMEVVTVTPEKRGEIQKILQDMNAVSYRTYTTQREVEVEKTDKHGDVYFDTEIITETHLAIEITRKKPQQMAQIYDFNAEQNEQLSLLLDAKYSSLWVRLLGETPAFGGTNDGEIMRPAIGGSGMLSFPLPIQGVVTSPFGYRKDPFSGKWSFHRGTDISAPNGTPILAAADGTVIVANATDKWGYSWGYYVKIQHANSTSTLYAHCSAIAVKQNQQVKQGEVIAYVGSTGASTGNHLHFEVEINGTLVDAMSQF